MQLSLSYPLNLHDFDAVKIIENLKLNNRHNITHNITQNRKEAPYFDWHTGVSHDGQGLLRVPHRKILPCSYGSIFGKRDLLAIFHLMKYDAKMWYVSSQM